MKPRTIRVGLLSRAAVVACALAACDDPHPTAPDVVPPATATRGQTSVTITDATPRPQQPIEEILAALANPELSDGTLIIGIKEPGAVRGVSVRGKELPAAARFAAERALRARFSTLPVIDGVIGTVQRRGPFGVRTDTFHRTAIRVRPPLDRALLQAMRANPFVDYIQPNYTNIVTGGAPLRPPGPRISWASTATVGGFLPTMLNLQSGEFRAWGIDSVRAPNVWGTYTGVGVGVFILDSGADLEYSTYGAYHPDMNFSSAMNNYAAHRPDNRCPNDLAFRCYWEEPFHGTGVVGALMGTRNNVGAVGTAPANDYGPTFGKVSYLDVNGNFQMNEIDLADAARNLSYHNVFTNIPIGVSGVAVDDTNQANHPYLHDAFRTAYYQYDVLWFAIANDNVAGKPVILPGRFPEVMAVGSVTPVNGQLVRAPISPVDSKIDFVAPGTNLRLPWNRDNDDPAYPYTQMVFGNSFATPIAAGVARLAMQAHPNWTAGDLLFNMQLYSRTLGPPDHYGFGMPDAVCLINQGPANCPRSTPFSVRINGPVSVRPSATCVWWATTSGGTSPFNYVWYVNGRPVPGSGSELTYRNTFTSGSSFTIRVEVTDNGGNEASDTHAVSVSSTAQVCPF